MPRRLRVNTGGIAYHVLNRAVARDAIFLKEFDYLAFEKVLADVHERLPTRLISYCLMPNHWHMVLWPKEDGELSEFLRLVTVTHTQRWHAHYKSAGSGPLYQGRFKSFPIQRDDHLLTVMRYVERNPLRAGLVEASERWQWGSLNKRFDKAIPKYLLPVAQWPIPPRREWIKYVNAPQTPKEFEAMQLCVRRGRPFGDDAWIKRTARSLNLQSTLTPRGRPEKAKKSG